MKIIPKYEKGDIIKRPISYFQSYREEEDFPQESKNNRILTGTTTTNNYGDKTHYLAVGKSKDDNALYGPEYLPEPCLVSLYHIYCCF